MKKYLVKLIFKVEVDGKHADHEFDEQVRVVEARFTEEAFYKARSLGKAEEEVFKHKQHTNISWVFIDVSELYAIEQTKHGEQLYSRTHHSDDDQAFISHIRRKSMEIQVKNLTFA